jgi:hypothetical protein
MKLELARRDDSEVHASKQCDQIGRKIAIRVQIIPLFKKIAKKFILENTIFRHFLSRNSQHSYLGD